MKKTYSLACRITPQADLEAVQQLINAAIDGLNEHYKDSDMLELKTFKEDGDTIFTIACRGERTD